MSYRIPLFDLNYGWEEEQALLQTVRSKWISTGPKCAEFESVFADTFGCKHAVALSSCTGALHIALRCLGLGEGDEVIVPSLTYVATANAIRYVGASPVFCDIKSADDLTIDSNLIQDLITARTKAIIVMHYAGFPCDMESIMNIANDRQLNVVEDACHAPLTEYGGSTLGTIGDVGCFSFFSNKNISTGEGGMLVTNDSEIHQKAKLLRSHGMTTLSYERAQGRSTEYDVTDLGFNYRMDDMRASLGIAQLKKLKRDLCQRATVRACYLEQLTKVEGITVPFSTHCGFTSNYIFPIVLRDSDSQLRDRVRQHMAASGIQTSVHYPAVHRFSTYADSQTQLPNTEYLSDNEITLPMYSKLDTKSIALVVDALQRATMSARP